MSDFSAIEKRISEAFGFASRQEIAGKMEVNYQTLSNWLKGRTDFPSGELAKIASLTDYSLNWILTGKGEKRTAKPQTPNIINEENLVALITKVVRRELAMHFQDFVEMKPADMILAPIIARVGDDEAEESVRKAK